MPGPGLRMMHARCSDTSPSSQQRLRGPQVATSPQRHSVHSRCTVAAGGARVFARAQHPPCPPRLPPPAPARSPASVFCRPPAPITWPGPCASSPRGAPAARGAPAPALARLLQQGGHEGRGLTAVALGLRHDGHSVPQVATSPRSPATATPLLPAVRPLQPPTPAASGIATPALAEARFATPAAHQRAELHSAPSYLETRNRCDCKHAAAGMQGASAHLV
jgi:hypothetical protein